MTLPEMYDYLTRSRRDLRQALESLPDDLLARPLLSGDRFHCIKDLVFHIAAVEDGWLHEDILRLPPVLDNMPAVAHAARAPDLAHASLAMLLDYWHAVERGTRSYLATLTEEELSRIVTVHDAPDERYTVDGLLWHVMLHEVRHTAQICMLLRSQGIKPPALDLLFHLPQA